MDLNTFLLVAILVVTLFGFCQKPAYSMTFLAGAAAGVLFVFVIAIALQDGSLYMLQRGFYAWRHFLEDLLYTAIKIALVLLLITWALRPKKEKPQTAGN